MNVTLTLIGGKSEGPTTNWPNYYKKVSWTCGPDTISTNQSEGPSLNEGKQNRTLQSTEGWGSWGNKNVINQENRESKCISLVMMNTFEVLYLYLFLGWFSWVFCSTYYIRAQISISLRSTTELELALTHVHQALRQRCKFQGKMVN